MTINSISNDTQYVSPLSSGTDNTLGKDEFLNLLVTQLQHQDPLNPNLGQGFWQRGGDRLAKDKTDRRTEAEFHGHSSTGPYGPG